jgi:hypothetical protein
MLVFPTINLAILMGKQNKSKEPTLPIIKCECGAEILLIPDLTEMGKAISNHAHKHAETIENPEEAKAIYSKTEHSLTAQTLRKASQIE